MKTKTLEQTLIVQAKQGDLEAFNELVLEYQDSLYHYALSLVSDSDQADDIAQETFVKAFQHIGSLQGGSFRAWLFKIATNTTHDMGRRSARHPMIPLYPQDDDTGEENDSPEWIVDPDQSVEKTVQQNETALQLYCLLDELPAGYRSILTLIDLQEMDYSEAAEVLKIPLGTVKSRLARARVQMRNLLQSGAGKCFPNATHPLAV